MVGKRVKSLFWWTYYGLFLGICIFMFLTAVKYLKGFLLAGTFNFAKFLYGMALAIMIFGLLSMAIAYLTKTLWIKVTRIKRGI